MKYRVSIDVSNIYEDKILDENHVWRPAPADKKTISIFKEVEAENYKEAVEKASEELNQLEKK